MRGRREAARASLPTTEHDRNLNNITTMMAQARGLIIRRPVQRQGSQPPPDHNRNIESRGRSRALLQVGRMDYEEGGREGSSNKGGREGGSSKYSLSLLPSVGRTSLPHRPLLAKALNASPTRRDNERATRILILRLPSDVACNVSEQSP